MYVHCYIAVFPNIYVWQSWVEIEHYSVAYFDRITALKRCSTVLPLRVGLISDTQCPYHVFMHLFCSVSNTVMQWKYTTE